VEDAIFKEIVPRLLCIFLQTTGEENISLKEKGTN